MAYELYLFFLIKNNVRLSGIGKLKIIHSCTSSTDNSSMVIMFFRR